MFSTSIYGLNLMLLIAASVILWLYSLRSKNVNAVDVAWGMGFVVVTWLTWIQVRGERDADLETVGRWREWVILAIVTLWGLRLSVYLTWRNWGKPEDRRYAAMRSHWGERFRARSFFTVFFLQAVLIWFISLTIQVGLQGSAASWLQILAGLLVWQVGWTFETIGDWQLAAFKRDPRSKGKVMDRGLWRYTRHPNYFGDFMVWWGIFLVTAQPDSWWWTISGPALMSFLLIRVSGVRLLESSLSQRVDGYADYVRRTSSFIPWPPRRSRSVSG
jgi:steroid 5-alpha reductase family enzyme